MDWVRRQTVAEGIPELTLAANELSTTQCKLDRMNSLTKFLLNNPDGDFCQKWDVVMIVALVFTATVTPYEVAFVETKIDAMFAINRLIDLLFFSDMVLQVSVFWEINDHFCYTCLPLSCAPSCSGSFCGHSSS
jgi:hypothetical protein